MATDEQQLSGDPSQPIDTRGEDRLSRMNLDEKLARAGCVWSRQLVEDHALSERKARELLASGPAA